MSAGDPLGLSGQILHEQFRVGELAEDSARASLYKGAHVGSDVPVALKFLKVPEGGDHEALVRRFRHESRLHYALAQASPHVVRMFASGSIIAPGKTELMPFNVLEWLRGKTLASDFAERRAHWGKGRTVEETIALLDPAAEALATAHLHNVIHREVTPANLFLSEAHEAPTMKVLDFGYATLHGEMLNDLQRAQTIDLGPLPSPIYAAPEQFSRDAGEVGPSTDIYSLMMIFMEALRDRPVMDDTGSPLAVRVLDAKNRPTPRSLGIKIGASLELVICEAIAVKTAHRPQDLAEFWVNLKRAALKDARSVSISSPPSLHARGVDAGPEDSETEVAINMSFLHPSRAVTIPRPEPVTLSRPFDEAEAVSSTGELFTMAAEQAQIPTARPMIPPRAKTLVSPGQTHPDDIDTAARINVDREWKATLVSSATPIALLKKEST
ncbi:MAG: protein kinase, partial [Polyangiaceae bacterium]